MKDKKNNVFITGFKKYIFYIRIALHVVIHFFVKMLKGEISLKKYIVFVYRAYIFLKVVRHNKIVRLGEKYKIHLYIPAYPTRSFFYTLEKLLRDEPGPATVVFSMTKACMYKCPHCYQQKDLNDEIDVATLIKTAHSMQDIGVSMFDIEGGEPLLKLERLLRLMNSIDDRSEIWLNTTGYGVKEATVKKLASAGISGVMVSIHIADPLAYDRFTGIKGSFEEACEAIHLFNKYKIFTAINCCPSPENILGNGIKDMMELSYELDCSYVQIIHGKSAGAWLGKKDEFNDSSLIERLRKYHIQYNGKGVYKDHPSLSAQVFEESEDIFGCTAGGVDRFYIGSSGEVQPCEFLNISFGNVKDEDFITIFRRMRSFFKIPGSSWLCCTKASFINEVINKHNIETTPVPWEITKTFISKWDQGRETA